MQKAREMNQREKGGGGRERCMRWYYLRKRHFSHFALFLACVSPVTHGHVRLCAYHIALKERD